MNTYKQYTYINPHNNTVTLTLSLKEYLSIRPYIQLIKTTTNTTTNTPKPKQGYP